MATFLIFFSLTVSVQAEEPCPSAVEEAHPIDEMRSSGTFSVTSALACENASSSFYINNLDILNTINDTVVAFCLENGGSEESICEDDAFFNFKSHPDSMESFIDYVKDDLVDVSLPSNASSLKEGNDISDDQIKAMMYLCTIEAEREFVKKLKDPSLSIADKFNAIETYKVKGLFTQFMNSVHFMEVVRDSSIPEELRKKFIREALSNQHGDQPIREIATRFKILNGRSDRTATDESLLTLLTSGIDEFVKAPREQQNRPALQLLSNNGFPGAQEAFNAFLTGAVTSAFGLGDKTIPLLNGAPKCEEREDATLRDKTLARNAMYEFLITEAISDNTISSLVDSTKYIPFFAENLNNDERWKKLEEHISLSHKYRETEATLNAARNFYCFNKNINDKLKLLNQSSTSNKSEIAGEILVELLAMNPGIDMLSAVLAIQPYLNDEQVASALTLIRNMGSVPNMQRNQVAEEIRIRVLKDIFSRYTGGIDRGERLHQNARTAIVALAENGGKVAEQNLADLFVQYDSPELRVHIINQYGNAFFLNQVGSDFSIVQRLAGIKNRGQYADYLIKKIQGVATTDGFTGSGAANTRDKVLTSIRDGLLSNISTLVAPDVDGSLSEATRRQQGIVDGRVDEAPVTTDKRPIVLSRETNVEAEQIKVTNTINKPFNAINLNSGMGDGKPTLTRGFSVSQEDMIKEKVRAKEELQALNDLDAEAQQETLDKLSYLKEKGDLQEAQGSLEQGTGGGGSGGVATLGTPRNSVVRRNTPLAPVLPSNQKDFITGLGNNILPNTFGNGDFSPLPQVGEVNSRGGKDSFNSSFRGGTLTSPLAGNQASTLKGNEPVDETTKRIENLTREAKSLREEISKRDESPQRLPIEDGSNAFIPNVKPRNGDLNPEAGDRRVAAARVSPGRGPASVPAPQAAAPIADNSRGPASISSPGSTENAPKKADLSNGTDANNFTTILSPIEDLSKEDLSKVIKIKDKELKDLLMDFMTERKKLSCPELRFVQDFYETHIDNFILVKKRKPWREYALVEMEDLTFRFNYPGGKKVQNQIEERCSKLSREVTSIGEDEVEKEKEDKEEMVEKALPSEENTGIFKSFMLKLGL